jgi:hypothetical protein
MRNALIGLILALLIVAIYSHTPEKDENAVHGFKLAKLYSESEMLIQTNTLVYVSDQKDITKVIKNLSFIPAGSPLGFNYKTK